MANLFRRIVTFEASCLCHMNKACLQDRLLSLSEDYRRKSSSSSYNPDAPRHGDRAMRSGARDYKPCNESPSKRKGGKNPQREEESSLMVEGSCIMVNCVENGQTVIRISKREDHQGDPTPRVLDKNQLLQMLLNALQRNENLPTENS